MYDAMLAETVAIAGAGGDEIEAYLARPLSPGPHPGVVVIHHMPGYDAATKQIVRAFAAAGYSALCPNLFHRFAPGAEPDDAAAAGRAASGVPDEQMLGDVDGAARALRALSNANGRVGVIGYCSGGRQTYVAACRLDLQAAVDCYGGRVVVGPDEVTPAHPVPAIDMTPDLRCPLLGLFGGRDANPSPEHVARMAQELTRHGKDFTFHTHPDAGHSFFAVDRPAYHVEAATQGWREVLRFFGAHLRTDPTPS